MSAEHDNELMDRARATSPLVRTPFDRLVRMPPALALDKLPQDCGHAGTRTLDGRCEICGGQP